MKTRAFVLRMIKITVRFSHIILRKVRGKLGKRSFPSQFTDPKKKHTLKCTHAFTLVCIELPLCTSQ